ncbi:MULTISPECIES: TonB-dependent receptor domain-containing protein [unclassified Sphingomonas]|uniref:TonB-dependent receptor domain-containing protein n=1 Tax=unclassified Sphingomonas TaxID=196159 RepID=UPI0007019C48|nr:MULTISPECIES: TonB-dependent receptor [unclassified Sphingomonas]KQM26360.1 TonB-dependent receptor [Sphingomonas sp. Leaf9]KQM42769.1 TonB-dependent receptor [Sphingomonas sp. Leaf11]
MKAFHILLASTALALPLPALAQSADAPATDTAQPADDTAAADADIIVTGVARGQNRLDSSVSVSSLDQATLQTTAPRSVAELFRNIPGVRSESSGGEGNANIAVRGLPVASGGSKFLQLQEDGLPILEYGDITFGNADIFLRADLNVARVEAIRGGSASTFASNSPGGVINLISDTSEREGAVVQGSTGIDYRDFRTDFSYGKKLSDSLRVHVGGFYRFGTGPRQAGYDANRGGQIKLNVTKEFAGGYVRVYGKYLDDRAIAYLPNPIRVSGTNDDPKFSEIAGFSINRDTLHSPNITRNLTLDGGNNPVVNDIRDGQHPVVKAVGFETKFDLAEGWSVTNRFRYSDISGRFISNFPANVDSAATIATALAGAGSTLSYATGPNAGRVIANPAALNGNGLLAEIVVFDTKLNSLDNITNDFRLTHDIALGGGTLGLTAGFYKSRQTIDTDWLWTSLLSDVVGGGNAALVNVRNAVGTSITQNGVYGYAASYFGGCCRRSYDLNYDTNAPFASLNWSGGALTLDGSVRYDFGQAKGTVSGADLGGGRVGTVTRDINGDGVISDAERRVAVIPLNSPAPVDYDFNYWSYSLGANYRLSSDLAVFGRYSRGGRANADRLLFGPAVSTTTGGLLNRDAAVDIVRQAEAGMKYRANGVAFYATGFWARTEEQNFEATTQRFFDRNYRAYGVELEGNIKRGPFSLTAGGTWTDAKIVSDAVNPATVGNRPRRQAEFVFSATPQIEVDQFTVGANVIGTTSSYAQDSNQLKLPGYTQVNAFVQFRSAEQVQFSVNANNLFDTIGLTEAEEGAIPANGIIRARSINGRTISATARFSF